MKRGSDFDFDPSLETPRFSLLGTTSGIEPWCDRPVVLLDDHVRSIPVDECCQCGGVSFHEIVDGHVAPSILR